MTTVSFDIDELRPLIEAIVAETMAATAGLGDQIAMTESQAASKFGMASHQLRDSRLRGELTGCRIGRRWYYQVAEFRQFVASHRVERHHRAVG